MAKGYSAAVRHSGGPWQGRVWGQSAREAKRALAKKLGLPLRWGDSLPLGRGGVVRETAGGWNEVVVEGGR